MMSTPRCIRLAIRACKPVKISNPAARCSSRSLVTTQSFREDGKRDIKAGFPEIPTAREELPQSPARNDTSVKPPKNTRPLPDSQSAVHVKTDVAERPTTEENAATGLPGDQRPLVESATPVDDRPRLPRNVVAAYHKPLRVAPKLGVRVASLQLRSYSVRSLEFMCDFALRAAYFLGLPASGPVPLPKKIERWTVPRSNFVHKKSQENFERITRRRAIQIMDGHKDVVQIWLAYLRKHQFYGVGMKADVWEFEGMDVAGSMDRQFQEVEKELDEKLSMFGWNKQVAGDKSLVEQLQNMGPGQQTGVSMQHIREASRSASRI